MTTVTKAVFVRKAVDLEELIASSNEKNKQEFAVEKKIELDAHTFKSFADALYKDWDFIRNNIELMYLDGNGIRHCILIFTKSNDIGILVEAEGFCYARYAATYILNL